MLPQIQHRKERFFSASSAAQSRFGESIVRLTVRRVYATYAKTGVCGAEQVGFDSVQTGRIPESKPNLPGVGSIVRAALVIRW